MAGEDIVIQRNLGRVANNYKPSTNMSGIMYLAKVTKVHHKSNTVDVTIVKSLTKITSSEENEGNLGARIVVSNANFNEETQVSSGVVEPYQKDQLVVVAFLDNTSGSAVILGSFHNTIESENNPLTSKYPLDLEHVDDYREALKYLRVTPSQMYNKIDGIGAVEVSLPSTTFLKIDPDFEDVIEDKHGGFEHSDLSEKDPYRYNNTRKGVDESSQMPVKLLFVHNSNFYEDYTTWTKFFLDKTGLFRVTRDNNDEKVTYIELNEEGQLLFRRHLDHNEFHHDKESKDFIETKVTEEGELKIHRKKDKVETKVSIDEHGTEITLTTPKGTMKMYMNENGTMGMKHHTGSFMQFTDNGELTFKAKKINFNEG